MLLSACFNEDVSCVTTAYDTVRVNFFKLDRQNARTDTLYFESVSAANGVFLDIQDTSLSQISLPLNPSADEAIFYVDWRETEESTLQLDTLVLSYQREQQLVSPECGVEQRFVGLTSSNPAFDSLSVVEDEVTLFSNPISVYTCQYEFTDLARTRFLRLDTVSTDPLQTTQVETDLLIRQITDDLGNTLLAEPDTLRRFSLPLNVSDRSTTFTFEVVVGSEIVERELQLTYLVDTLQIFDCLPQITVSNLDVDAEDFNFADVNVTEEELNTNNNLNLEILF